MQQTLLLLILFVVLGLGHGFSRDIVCTSFIKINNICKNRTKAPFILVYLFEKDENAPDRIFFSAVQ